MGSLSSSTIGPLGVFLIFPNDSTLDSPSAKVFTVKPYTPFTLSPNPFISPDLLIVPLPSLAILETESIRLPKPSKIPPKPNPKSVPFLSSLFFPSNILSTSFDLFYLPTLDSHFRGNDRGCCNSTLCYNDRSCYNYLFVFFNFHLLI